MKNEPQLDCEYMQQLIRSANSGKSDREDLYCHNCCVTLNRFTSHVLTSGDVCCDACGTVLDYDIYSNHSQPTEPQLSVDRKLIERLCRYNDTLISSVLEKMNLISSFNTKKELSRGPGKRAKIIVCLYYALMEVNLSIRPLDLCEMFSKEESNGIVTRHINMSISAYMSAVQSVKNVPPPFHSHGTPSALIPICVDYLRKKGVLKLNMDRLRVRGNTEIPLSEDLVVSELCQFTEFLSKNISRFARALPFSVAAGVIYIAIMLDIAILFDSDGERVAHREVKNAFSAVVSTSKSTISSLYKHYRERVKVSLHHREQETGKEKNVVQK